MLSSCMECVIKHIVEVVEGGRVYLSGAKHLNCVHAYNVDDITDEWKWLSLLVQSQAYYEQNVS